MDRLDLYLVSTVPPVALDYPAREGGHDEVNDVGSPVRRIFDLEPDGHCQGFIASRDL